MQLKFTKKELNAECNEPRVTKISGVDTPISCHDPSHGGSYVAEGAYFIRIGLPPRVVPGDFLNLSLYGLI